MHGLLVGDHLAHEGLVVDAHNLVTGQQTGLFRRTVGDDVLHVDGVLTDGKLNAYSREGTLQVVIGYLNVLRGDIHRVGIQLRENLRHGTLHQVFHVDGIHILVIDNLQQTVQLITA